MLNDNDREVAIREWSRPAKEWLLYTVETYREKCL